MKAAAFKDLLESVRDTGAYLKSDRKAIVRTDRVSPNSVAAIRAKLKLSQAQFARAFGISVDTLQNWEQGRRKLNRPAKVLLRVANQHPEAVANSVWECQPVDKLGGNKVVIFRTATVR